MTTLTWLSFMLSTLPALAESPFGDGFAGGNPHDYVEGDFQPDHIRITSLDGVNSLLVTDTQAHLRPVRVAPNTKYTLTLDSSFSGEVESLEDNPRFVVFAQPWQKSTVLPSREIQFLDSAGNATGPSLVFGMPLRRTHTYSDVFYTPPNAAAVRLRVASGEGITLAMRNLTLEKAADEGAINTNPAFQLGPLNYSGWQNISAGGQIMERDGKTVFDTKYGSRGMRFPLPGAGTYGLSAKATANGYNSCVKVDVFDAKGEKIMTSVLRQYGQTVYFVPPPEAVSASLLIYSCLLEEVRVVRVGDEKAIEAIRSE